MPEAGTIPRPLTISEVAAVLGVSRHTARAMARNGALPAVRIGRSWRVRLADLDALLTPSHNPGPATPQLPRPLGDAHPHAPEPAHAQAPAPAASVPADFIEETGRSSSSGF